MEDTNKTIDGIRCGLIDGAVFLKLEDIARGLGIVDKGQYIRWQLVRKYMDDMGFSHEFAKSGYVTEECFFALAGKIKKQTAQNFQRKVRTEIIPELRKEIVIPEQTVQESSEIHKMIFDFQDFSNHEFGHIRALQIDNEPWFVGKDVAKALGYSNPRKALDDHVDAEDKRQGNGVTIRDSIGRSQHPTIVNESGLYSLIFASKLPTAKAFKRWVTAEVLPCLRKHGAYLTPDVMEQIVASPEFAIRILTALQNEREKNQNLEKERIALVQENQGLKEKANYADDVLSSGGTMLISQIAADYGMSGLRLNQILYRAGIQRKVGEQWVLYAKYMGKGYTESKTTKIVHSDGRTDSKVLTVWTQKGRNLIHQTLSNLGFLSANSLSNTGNPVQTAISSMSSEG